MQDCAPTAQFGELSAFMQQIYDDIPIMEYAPSSQPSRIFRCCCRRRFPLQRESNPLFRAVLSNDLAELKKLIQDGNSVNIQNTKGSLLLNFVMRRKRVEIFDYLMSLEQLDVNILDRLEQSPLIYLAGVCFDDYFATKLIEKGADIHATDDSGFNFLHLAARSDSDDTLEIGRTIIEKGADLNHQGHFGITPLYSACEVGSRDWICMLLYYGADVFIPSDRGVLPISILCENLSEDDDFLEEILFSYTFDNLDKTIQLSSLVATMTQSSNLFPKILQHINEINFDLLDLQYFVSSLIHIKPEFLKLFMEKFGFIIKEMIENFPPLDALLKMSLIGFSKLKEILVLFLTSDYVAEFVQSSESNATIWNLHQCLNHQEQTITLEEFTEIVTIMLSYGLKVTSADLDLIYENYGNCQLFQILLHMEIISVDQPQSIARLYYDPFTTINSYKFNTEKLQPLINFFNHPKLKELILQNNLKNEEIVNKVENLPQVPLLTELSRNSARQFIVEKFKIVNSMQFNTILKWLPIGDMNQKILSLQKELY